MPRALITGVTGQDGQHLAEFLNAQGYEVYGLVKGQNNPRIGAIVDEMPWLNVVQGDLADLSSLVTAVDQAQPDEVYNLGAVSFVAYSFTHAELTGDISGLGVLRMLDAIRMVGGMRDNPIRFYQASTSEMFGEVREVPQTEMTPFHPRSPYGCAKVFGHYITMNYRESYGMYACSGILFNHEGPRRGIEFVTRKITNAVARIHLGLQDGLALGNLEAKRDWGYAGDYVKAMWLMLQQEAPEDFVIATGRQESVRRFIELTAAQLGWGAIEWQGEGLEETGLRADTGAVVVRIDPRYFRPAEVETLLGDPTRAKEKLGWTPTTTLEELVAEMVAADREEAKKEAYLKRKGFQVVGSMENPPTNPEAIKAAGGAA